MIVNTTYALVWNRTRGGWQAVGERTRRRGKSRAGVRGALAVAVLAGGAVTAAHALPAGEKIVSGKADVLRFDDGRQMSINQHSDKLVTEWTAFGVDAGQRVTFNQPSAASVALNRVVGNDASQIHGSIDASGRVFLVNPNGVLFGRGARVNVGGLVASTLDIRNEDFEAGRYRFSGSSPASIVNNGDLVAGEGGAIALLGAKVFNRGVVRAQLGTVALGAGNDITLNFDGGRLLNMQIDKGAVEALASNEQLLKADGGLVLMSAKTASDLAATVVNNQGSLEARTLRNTAGRITLDGGERGVVNVAGVLNASASTPGDGGTIVTRGADVQVALGAMADTRATNGRGGVWRIAAADVAVKPGANQSGTIIADTLARNLATTDVELVAERGGLSVDGPVAWASGNQLSLASRAGSIAVNGALRGSGAGGAVRFDAAQDVRIAAPVAVTGANGRVTLNYGGVYSIGSGAAVTMSGANPGFESNGFRYTVIQNLAQLQSVNTNLGGLFVLGNDINGPYSSTFQTIGSGAAFSGTFDGLGNTIGKLSITSGDPYAGLFGLNTGRIANLKLQGMKVSGGVGVGPVMIGALAGENRGTVTNVTVTGSDVRGGANRNNALGGLIGVNHGTIEQASFAGIVMGNALSYAVGGLVGENNALSSRGLIAGGTSNATVSGGAPNLASIGGLVGVNRLGGIVDAVSLGSTSGYNLAGVNVGGLVGANLGGAVTRGTASGRSTGGSGGTVGGLAGINGGTIADSEARGIVEGYVTQAIGGFVGLNQGGIRGSRALGATSTAGTGAVGGFVGLNQGDKALIDMAEAHGAVTGGQGNTGGFVGSHLGGAITHAVSRGKTSGGHYGRVGGFAGYNAATLASVDASGEVSAGTSSSIGGLVGYNAISGAIESASATGDVTGGQSSTVGGLIGDNLGTVQDASASGAVGGGCVATLGGLVGMNMGLVERSAASGRVKGSSAGNWRQTYGGLVGINRGTFRYSYTSGEAAQQQLAGLNLGVIE
ncbi:filamentous hemagglutinin N-terminal domain-containing protein [Burkholderia sp. FERM BP-3421]|jgi:filamentous hemagglutinin family protein|uniref:two-partner secretion domain-containing protein n=1 Tax=Burkholderia sp. FERM BP-3421 TaxID=1494466 RepID=UPI002362A7CA|nr:filamentous hemagglutinin N-terminal domain-containing protein [Burkholderia sp. FERM BP-3421]WDD94247.1 filamentous hemagglutinin N-terminal domain-containing protein [Burkholderia sp. FERM BP-3421]